VRAGAAQVATTLTGRKKREVSDRYPIVPEAGPADAVNELAQPRSDT